MIRWVAAIFVLLAVFYPLLPFLARAGVGRMPGTGGPPAPGAAARYTSFLPSALTE